MLLRLAIRNYKSFGSEDIRLELIPASKDHGLKSHVIALGSNVRVLRNAVVYGSNAAGKSNVIDAISFIIGCVRRGRLPKQSVNSYCKVHESGKSSPSVFDVQFSVGPNVYDYGFSCVLAEGSITAEWLYDVNGQEPIALFERDETGEFKHLFEGIAMGEAERTRLQVYSDDFLSDKSPGLFLTALCKHRRYEEESPLVFVARAWSWLSNEVEVIGADDHRGGASFYGDTDIQTLADMIASFDTGVSGFSKEEVGIDELRGIVPGFLLERVQESFEEISARGEVKRAVRTLRSDNAFIGFEWEPGWDDVRATILRVKHRRSFFDYDFGEESDGTKRLFDFMDMLFSTGRERTFVVDELNRSLHPMITVHFVKLFNEIHHDDRCQLLFTTHEDAVMRLDLFRRDEIWFVERRADGCSHLYSLEDFGVRSDASLGKQYLEGRYGGIPILSVQKSLDSLRG